MTVVESPKGRASHNLGNRCAIPTFPPPGYCYIFFQNLSRKESSSPPAPSLFRLILRLEKTPTASFFSKSFHQSLAGVGTQVVHDQMDGIGLRIASGDIQQVIGKLGRAASRSHLGEVPSRLGLDPAKHVGGSATLVFIVSPGSSSRLHRDRGTGVGMQHHRLLVDADHRCPL